MSNFLQWNPNQINQESDTQYAADSMRAGGAGDPAIFPSATANKLFYQISTFIAAAAQALTNKGYSIVDTNLANLTAQLQNLITAVDLAPYLTQSAAAATYAPIASPAFAGTPTAPTPGNGDDSSKLATTAYVQNQGYAPESWVSSTFTPLSDFALVNAGGAGVYYKLPGGLILQMGSCGVGTATLVSFPIAFPNGFYVIVPGNIGPGGGAMNPRLLGTAAVNSSSFHAWCYDATGAASSTNMGWIAIGF
jgi:hypothetical protein